MATDKKKRGTRKNHGNKRDGKSGSHNAGEIPVRKKLMGKERLGMEGGRHVKFCLKVMS